MLLSIALLVHNEKDDLLRLMPHIEPYLGAEVELVILDDFSNPETTATLADIVQRTGAVLQQRKLSGHFARQRNALKSLCQGRFILCLDPDELPPPGFLDHLPSITAMMDTHNLDLCVLPRANSLLGADGQIVARLQNFPDMQERFLRNIPRIRWVNRVHERLVGYRRKYSFPADEKYAIPHIKPAKKLETANIWYDQIQTKRIDKYRKILYKMLGLIQKDSVALPVPY
jgi:glycosyltransferase involved in cell wall biosynthesis